MGLILTAATGEIYLSIFCAKAMTYRLQISPNLCMIKVTAFDKVDYMGPRIGPCMFDAVTKGDIQRKEE